jgi:hypothetical protein
MKRLCLFSFLFKFLFALSIGFNYRYEVPKEAFFAYDWLVIHPNVKTYKTNSKLIAYISIGENVEKLNKKWILQKNKSWNSYIMDIRNKDYQNYLLKKIEKAKNFDGFFFDTLDSYHMAKVNKKEYKKALIEFLKKVKEKYPQKIIIFNRGFELLDFIKPTAIVAENLFTLNGKSLSKSDQNWLIDKLNYAKSKGILPIVIEYLEPFNREKAIKIAKKIASFGFIPYVSDKNLYSLGVSNTYLFPRKILVIYNVDKNKKKDSLAHTMISMPLEFLGYIPDLVHINELPKDTSIYQAIIIVLENSVKNKIKYKKWLKNQIKQNKKVLFLSTFGIDDLSFLNIKTEYPKSFIYSLYKTSLKEFETSFSMSGIRNYLILNPQNAIKLLSFKNRKNQITTIAAKTKWGGYFINPFENFGNIFLWRVDPFEFIPYILELLNVPLPDFTTENGNRIWFSHIDGDGFVNRNDKSGKFAAEVLYENIFTKYNLPFSESVIEGEIAPYGIYPKDSKKAIKIAKKIFKLKNIEPASHSFSHPFDWADPKHPRLPIKNYKFSYKREIEGSLKFVSDLAGKKSNLFFWTGECNPPKNILEFVYKKNILNINGRDTCILNSKKFLFYVAPLGIYKGDFFQPYAQIANENIFTDLWKNKLGYIKAIQTIRLTENPRRLKPIDVYFHNYSGAYQASLYALKRVIDFSIKQNVVPMFTSEWIKIALDFENSYILKDLDGNYIFKNSGNLRTLKIKGNISLDLQKSKGVIGYIFDKGYTYISLDNNQYHKIVFGKSKIPYLIKANKRLISLKNNVYKFDNRFGKLKVKFFVPDGCKVLKVNGFVRRLKCAVSK